MDRTYRDQVDPITADKRGRVLVPTTLRRIVLALDVALVEERKQCNGDFLYVDTNSTGVITVKLNSTSEDPIPLTAQAAVEGVPMKDVFISCAAQPGKIINLWYGYQARFKPPSQSIATIGSITNPVGVQGPRSLANGPVLADLPVLTREVGIVYGASYVSNTGLGAAGTSQVFSAASNANGATIHAAGIATAAANNTIALLAKATAPTTSIDGVPILACISSGAAILTAPRLARAVFIPAGLGLFFFSAAVEAAAQRDVLYTLH